jgi:hypothetical protein
VLEEWATQKDERQPLPPGVSMPSVLTQQGDPNLPDGPIDAVFFMDSCRTKKIYKSPDACLFAVPAESG